MTPLSSLPADKPMQTHPHATAHLPGLKACKPQSASGRHSVLIRAAQWRARQLIGSALKLAGEPSLVLDLPCAADGFWPLLSTSNSRVVIAADTDAEHLNEALASLHASYTSRVHPLHTSVFAIDLGQNAVDCIFCMHYVQQIGDPQQRMALLREFNRVTRDSVIVSLWVDGNLEALRQPAQARHSGFIHQRAKIEEEFIQAGFSITGHRDFLPGWAMLRLYVLRKGR